MNDSDEYAHRFREAAHEMAANKIPSWYCINCGKENQGNRNFCWNCETKIDGTPTDNSENILRTNESGSNSGSRVKTKSSAPKHVTDSLEVRALMSRYWDAYMVAKVTVGIGEIIKTVAVSLAVLIVLATLLIAGKVGGGGGIVTLLLGIIGGSFVGGQFYLLGLIVMAQGQILKASLDGAVNSSPFLENEQRAKIMSLK